MKNVIATRKIVHTLNVIGICLLVSYVGPVSANCYPVPGDYNCTNAPQKLCPSKCACQPAGGGGWVCADISCCNDPAAHTPSTPLPNGSKAPNSRK